LRVLCSDLLEALSARGFGPFVAVPCSHLEPFLGYARRTCGADYLTANNEGEAFAIAAGSYLAGRPAVVLLQNSGLGNMVNPLTSLGDTFAIPALLIISWRGEPGRPDEPQHESMGRMTPALLQLLGIPHAGFPPDRDRLEDILDDAVSHMASTGRSYALLLRPGQGPKAAADDAPAGYPTAGAGLLTRRQAIGAVMETLGDDCVVVSTTGKTSRELTADHDRATNVGLVGSMGCASSVGLGLALGRPDVPVVVLDGDGAALMRLEAMVSVGHYRPANLVHVLLDNHAFDSTGGQPTLADTVDFVGVARACGYPAACTERSPAAVQRRLRQALTGGGPHLLHVPTACGADPALGRPEIPPPAVTARMRAALSVH